MGWQLVMRVIALAALLGLAPRMFAESAWKIVALSDTRAPGTDLSFVNFQTPTLNERGNIAFTARIPRVDETGTPIPCVRGGCIQSTPGAWYSDGLGTLQPLMVPGQTLPGAANADASAAGVLLNGVGTAAVVVQFSLGRGIYLSDGSDLQPVALPGQKLNNETLALGNDIRGLALSNSNEVLFYAQYFETATAASRAAYWVSDVSAIRPGPLLGDQRFGFSPTGNIAFSRVIVGQPFQRGVYLGDLNSQQVVLRSNESAPGSDLMFGYPQQPSVNDSGQYAVHVTLTPADGPNYETGLWTGDRTAMEPLALSGNAAPGADAAFKSFNYHPNINAAGTVVFSALVEGTGISTLNDQGIWRGTAESISRVVQKGDLAPGTNALFGHLALPASDAFYNGHAESAPVAINSHGQLAFIAQLVGPGVTASNDSGLWVESRSGELELILREGDQIAVAPNDLRQVAGFEFRFGGAYGSGFADNGRLAMRVRFLDGTEAIVINESMFVPEPGLANCLLALPPLSRYWRRRQPRRLPA